MAVNNTALSLAADGIAGEVVELSLHTGDPGGSGTSNELSGGDYDRVAVTYSAAVNGVANLTEPAVFDGPSGSGSEVTTLGFWAAGDTYLGSAALSANKTIGAGDTLTITAAPISVSAA